MSGVRVLIEVESLTSELRIEEASPQASIPEVVEVTERALRKARAALEARPS